MKSIMVILSCIIFILITGCQNSKEKSSINNDSDVLFSNVSPGNIAGGKLMNDVLLGKLTIQDVLQEKWETLAKKKIFFGHQSVGFNIIDGIKSVLAENPNIKLNIVETRDPSDFNVGVFAHFRVGINEDPQSKTEDFSQIIDSDIGGKVDISFHKYCFIDVTGNSDIENIFDDYAIKMKKMTKEYPDVKFIHVTIPLTTIQTGPKAWVKKILGRSVGGFDANIKRNNYNKLLISAYQNSHSIFDLAAVEALKPDGHFESFTAKGQTYLSLYGGYTTDGGHLNQLGEKLVAEKLLIFLALLGGN